MFFNQKIKTIIPFWIYCCLLTWWVSDHCFFWDTVQLGSKHAHWYFNHDFQYLLLPQDIDSGHPPLFGIYLAGWWKIFGKTLLVSHLSVLPFLLGIVWILYDIGQHFGNSHSIKYLILLVVVDPFFAGQSVLVSPDLVLVFAFLWVFKGILYQQYSSILFGSLVLSLISMRGMMICLGLYLWWSYTIIFIHKISTLTAKQIYSILGVKSLPFLPAGLLAITYLGYHYYATGWVGYHPNSPWAPSFALVNVSEFSKNIGILIWRFLDFGRLFLLGGLAWLFLQIPKTESINWGLKSLSLIFFLSLLLIPSLLIHKGLLNHRYLLPITISFTILFYHLLVRLIESTPLQKKIYTIAFIGLLTGNFWIYPKQIAQGWDATLAHLPYYELRTEMLHFINQKAIPPEEIGTVFPNIGAFEYYDLNNCLEGFSKKDFARNKYIFYSNVFNDFSDTDLQLLDSQWKVIKRLKSGGIEVTLFERK